MPRRRLTPLGFLPLASSNFFVPLGVIVVSAGLLFARLWLWPELLPAWLPAPLLVAIVAASFWGWVLAFRQLQALQDLPLSRIGSSAQGYARLEGRAALFPGKPLRSPVSGQACCWYSYRMTTFDAGGHVESEESETTEWSFMMSDGSGECVVDPAGASIAYARVRKDSGMGFSYREKLIVPSDSLCVIGEFSSALAAGISEPEIDYRVGQLVAEWKKDRAALVERFDLNRDGEFTEREWELVRSQARREVRAGIANHPPQAQNLISKPADGRPFLISVRSSEELASGLAAWAWLHFALFALGVAALAAWTLGYV